MPQTVEASNANIALDFHNPQQSVINDQDRQEIL